MTKVIGSVFLCLLLCALISLAMEKEEAVNPTDAAPVGPVADITYEQPMLPGFDEVTWTTGANMPTARYGAVSGWWNGRVYFSHGRISNAAPYNTNICEAYDPATNTWETMAPAPTARRMVGAGKVQSGSYLHSVGGRFEATTTVGTYERYDMANNTWVTLAPCTPRWAHGAAALDDGTVYVFGGSDATVNTSVQKYDPVTNTWTNVAPLPAGRGWCAGASLNGKVYCIGGSGANTMYEYDPATNTWTARAPLPANRFYHWAYGDPLANKIYSFGGATVSAPTPDVLVWDAATNTWTTETPMPGARDWPCVGGNDAGTAFVMGGFDGSAIYYNQNWIGDLGAANPMAPAAPTGFTVANNGAALMATLSWTNPTTTVSGQPLGSIDWVVIKRNNAPIDSLTGTPGQSMTYNDNVPAVGMYNYAVYCVNSYGDGLAANDAEWIGLDVPAGVTSLTGAGVGVTLVAVLDWVNPTAGAHGGYWPPGSIDGYTINRYGPSTATFNITGITTTYTDNTVPIQGWYHYGVIASNASGNGPEVMTANFYIGPPEMAAIPFNWVEINTVGTNTGITGDDQNLGPFPIGFGFNHYGTTFGSIRVCSNGFLSFTSTATTWSNTAIPNVAEPNNAIYPLWDDLYPPGGGIIYYYYDSDSSRFIVEWDNVMSYATPRTPQKFEAILYPNGDIDLMFHTIQAPCVNANTVGKENAAGDVAVQATFNGSGPLEPASSTGIRIFGQPAVVPNVTIGMEPVAPPIQIPPGGGSFNFNVSLINGETTSQTFDAWIMVQLPNGNWWGPALGPINLTLAGSFTLTRTRTQFVPANAPAGAYVYEGRVGTYPSIIWDADSFPFTKLAVGDGGALVPEWSNTGQSFEIGQTDVTPMPSAFTIGTRPNPFNPTTTLSFALPEAARVTLAVYDVGGRQVAELVNGWCQAGSHEVTFNGSNLASGIYVYRLTADNFTASGKMVLMK